MEEKVNALVAALKAKGQNKQAANVENAFALTEMPELKAVALEILAGGVDPAEQVMLALAAIIVA